VLFAQFGRAPHLSALAERINGLDACCQMPTIQRQATTATIQCAAHSTRLALTLSYVIASIPHFVSLKMRAADAFCPLGFLATLWQLALVTVFWMEAVIDVALEFSSAMKPRARANEDVPVEPLRTVATCRGENVNPRINSPRS